MSFNTYGFENREYERQQYVKSLNEYNKTYLTSRVKRFVELEEIPHDLTITSNGDMPMDVSLEMRKSNAEKLKKFYRDKAIYRDKEYYKNFVNYSNDIVIDFDGKLIDLKKINRELVIERIDTNNKRIGFMGPVVVNNASVINNNEYDKEEKYNEKTIFIRE